MLFHTYNFTHVTKFCFLCRYTDQQLTFLTHLLPLYSYNTQDEMKSAYKCRMQPF